MSDILLEWQGGPRYGKKLKPGDVLQSTDVFRSSSGAWLPCPCPGLKIQEGTETVWVRPDNE